MNIGKTGIEKILRKPFLAFSPFLVLMILIVIKFYDPSYMGDEEKYLNLSKNLLHGFYSPPAPNIYLGVGPGYPIILLPFLALKMPLVLIAVLNAVFYYLSIVLIYKTLVQFISVKPAFGISLFWAFYYNIYESIPAILPETIAPFLVSLFIYLIMKAFSTERIINRYLIMAGLVFGYLALTKVIFGYVLIFMLAGNLLLLALDIRSNQYRKGILVLLFAFLMTLPYLVYTYNLTGKVLYWGSVGGNNLYWMSTPYDEEYGNWFPLPAESSDTGNQQMSNAEFRKKEHAGIIKHKKDHIPGTNDYLLFNHGKDLEIINQHVGVEQDIIYKRLAINNIRSNPLKYISNCLSNAGRILFNYPYSYKLQKPETLLRFPLNGIILVLLIFTLVPAIINWRRILFPLRFLIFIFLLYFGGSLTGSAEIRMFTVIAPVLIVWIAYIIMKTLKINLNWQEAKQ